MRVTPGVVVAVLCAALVAGCGGPAGGPRPVTGTSTVQQAPPGVADPAEISIPKIGATSLLVRLGRNADHTIQVPPVKQPMQAGWFSGGPRPGEPGPAVILGHVNGGGDAGIFIRLHELAAGDEILVKRTDGSTARFVVRHVDLVPKTGFPTDTVYGDTADPQLRVITCGGSFDRSAHSYRDSVIVYATE
jgi:sortase (surface protein transpeptidase)